MLLSYIISKKKGWNDNAGMSFMLYRIKVIEYLFSLWSKVILKIKTVKGICQFRMRRTRDVLTLFLCLFVCLFFQCLFFEKTSPFQIFKIKSVIRPLFPMCLYQQLSIDEALLGGQS